MSVYLQDIPLDQALERFDRALKDAGLGGALGFETIPLDENAAGRVLGKAVWAKISSPHYHASAMDGFAVKATSTATAQPSKPVNLQVPEQAVYVDTGDPLPEWADAVLPVEIIEPCDLDGNLASSLRHPDSIRIRSACTPWSHVRPMGEDMVATELVLPAGQILRPVDLGAMAASGHTEVIAARQPEVAILPTGSELVPVGTAPEAGQIIEFNSLVLASQVKQWGGIPQRRAIIKDNFDDIRQKILYAAAFCDLILINAGSSAGEEDFTSSVIASLGEVLVHGVAVRPGHPVILGILDKPGGSGKVPVIGVPGYPVSAALTGEIIIEPLLARWLGRLPHEPQVVRAALTRKVTSPAGDDDYMRVAVGRVGERLLAAPISRGAGVITSLVRADGIAILPRGVQGLEAGAEVNVRLYRSEADLERTLFAIGSHDLTLDLLAQYLPGKGRRLASVNAGSLGGLIALRRGEAHFAGSHLLDEQTGMYNLSYVQQYLPGIAVIIMGWVGRSQGLLVQKGNPLGLAVIRDLTRTGVRFVNRQRGAGTRVLLDFALKQEGIQETQITGYEREEYTHMAVAAAVASGRANCGLGIAAAAHALDLDFVPLYREDYQLVIPPAVYESDLFRPVLELAADEGFRQAVTALPGYDVSGMGEIIARIP
jgi:putative molybdopterin biosynthesis protein